MNRTGLIVALAVAAVAGLAFGLFPQLDLAVARYFYGFVDKPNYFALRISPPLMLARNTGIWISTLLVAPAVAALVVKLILPRHKMLISGRAVVFLIATLALAPGLLVNVVLKDHWGRPRPIDVAQFGGAQHFRAWWDPRGDCPGNCSFVSGDVAGAAWTFAPAALAPPQWRVVGLWRGLRLHRRHGGDPRHGRRAFSERRDLRRAVHLPDRLAGLRPDLPLAAHAADRSRGGARARARGDAGL